MKITWYGHAAFRIETEGRSIILDPYRSPDCGGFGPIGDHADVVVVSHDNDRYHSHLGQIAGPFEVVQGLRIPPGGVNAAGLHFDAIPCFETPEKLPGDEVTIVHFRSEGLRVVHLGDLGHDLTPDELAPIRDAHVVMVPVGGPPTLAIDRIRPLLGAIGPRVVLPMHYLIPGKIDLDIRPIDDFLATVADWSVDLSASSSITVDDQTIGEQATITVLRPLR
jgi:L-ascorbate metabolism protein UlaG (beta-lactamase superfamily)